MDNNDVRFAKSYYGTTFITELNGKFFAGIPFENPEIQTHWVEIPESVYKDISDAICKTKKEFAERLEKSNQDDYWVPFKNEDLYCPVFPKTTVKVKLRCGDVLYGKAMYFNWLDKRGDFMDIIAYHVIQ